MFPQRRGDVGDIWALWMFLDLNGRAIGREAAAPSTEASLGRGKESSVSARAHSAAMESTGKQGQEREGEVLLPALAALPAADSRKCLRFSACDLISIADVLGSCVQPGNFDTDIFLSSPYSRHPPI